MTNTYDAIGRITQRRLGLNSNYDTTLTYKPGVNGSQTALLATYQNGGDTPYSYEYDANGNITEITQGNVSVTYAYNAANELIRENNGFTNQTVTYTYDNWGNLTEKNVYAYDENGLRLNKTVNNVSTNYYYNGSVLMSLVTGNDTLLFSYDASGKVVAVNCNGTYYYYLRNGQGDIVKLIDNSGAAVVEYTYDTWGKQLSCTGSLASTLGTLNPFCYRGYVYDEETGFYYLRSRYYDPTTCRFISADILLSTGQGVLGHNAYAYCGNNPVNRIDDEGEFWHIVAGAVIGAVIGAATSIVSQAINGEEINWAAVAVSAGAGALSGAITAACPCMGVVATGLVQGAIGAAAYAGTELAYGRTPTVEKTIIAGVTSGVLAAAGKALVLELDVALCFVAGTLVLTEDGQKPIEEIQEGDYVYASDPDTGESGYKRVVQTFERETNEIVRLQIDGETITTTPGHPFYVPQKGWTKAIELRAGDILVTSNGEYVILEKTEHEILESPVKVYNFEVEEFHTYYVGDTSILVHNSCNHNSEWNLERRSYWKSQYEANLDNIGNRSTSGFYDVTEKNMERMMSGKAPIGIDGKSVVLHHPNGIANDFYNYHEILQSVHTGSFKALHGFLFK